MAQVRKTISELCAVFHSALARFSAFCCPGANVLCSGCCFVLWVCWGPPCRLLCGCTLTQLRDRLSCCSSVRNVRCIRWRCWCSFLLSLPATGTVPCCCIASCAVCGVVCSVMHCSILYQYMYSSRTGGTSLFGLNLTCVSYVYTTSLVFQEPLCRSCDSALR